MCSRSRSEELCALWEGELQSRVRQMISLPGQVQLPLKAEDGARPRDSVWRTDRASQIQVQICPLHVEGWEGSHTFFSPPLDPLRQERSAWGKRKGT